MAQAEQGERMTCGASERSEQGVSEERMRERSEG